MLRRFREISEKVEAEESELEALRRKVREYEEKIKNMESELKIAEAVKKYIKPELVEGAVRLAELESRVRELEEKLAEERRLRIEAEKSREEAYSIAGSSIKKAIEALEEALKKLTISKPIQPVKEQVRLPPMESRIIRYLEERRGFYIKPHILAKRIGTRVSSERFREALNRLVTLTIKEELAPLVRRYYRELLSGAKKPVDFDRNHVILRMPREKFDKLSAFGEPNQILIDYIYSCELILGCRPLQVMAWKGMVKNIPDISGKMILDADKLFEKQLDIKEELTPYNIYSIPLALLSEIAKIIGESENYRVSARYLAGSLGLSLETLLFILGSIERAGFVRIDIVGDRKLVDALIELTDSGREVALLLLDISSQLNKKIEKAPTKESWWLNASVDLIYWKRLYYYAARIHVGPDDIWHYLTEEQRSNLEKCILRRIDGTYFSREALRKLIEMGITIPHLDFILQEAGDLVATYGEMLKIR